MFRQSIDKTKKYIAHALFYGAISVIAVSCASIGSPSGGDYDLDPPKVVSSTPAPNATFVKKGKVEIIFDELVQIEKPLEKVIVTPPQTTYPVVRAINNKVVVELKDTLKENTTYTIDFTDAISDNNEKNTLENFALSFSTGAIVDSLAISGKVLAANNLEPVSSMYVGIHSNLSDTAFTKIPFLRISRTNELGNFTIKGIAPGRYKVYALSDVNRSYTYDDPAEAIAFLSEIIVPTTEQASRQDSIFDIKHIFDTVKTINYTRFLPDDIILRSSISSFRRQYLQKYERPADGIIDIYFGAATKIPQIEPLNIPEPIDKWSILERTAGNDTLRYWITDPAVIAMDSIKLKVSYFKTDSLNQLQPVTDTLNFVNRNKRQEIKEEENKKKKKKAEEPAPIDFLQIKTDIAQAMNVYKEINFEFDFPLEEFDKGHLYLQVLKDSVYTDVDYTLLKDSLNPRKYQIQNQWSPGEQYRFAIDSAAVYSLNGRWNNTFESKFKIKTLDQYGSLTLELINLPDSVPAFVEILDKSDKVVFHGAVADDKAIFPYLDPGTYYARLIIDSNGNGRWDPGEYSEDRQPEMVYYYPKSFDIKAFWDITEEWNITELPADKQKPLEITQNKPKDQDKKKKDLERREANEKRRKGQSDNDRNDEIRGRNRSSNYENNSNNTF